MATSPIYGGLGMAGGAAPPAPWWAGVGSGLARNSNLLLGLGAGLLSGNLAEVPQGIATGAQTDRALFKDYTAEAKAKADENLMANWLKANRPDVTGLPTEAAFQLATRSPVSVGQGDTLVDPLTHKPIFSNSSGAPGGAYNGTSMDAQNWNIILGGKTDSPEYAAAYNQLFEQPKISFQATPQGMVPISQQPVVPKGVRPPAMSAPAMPAGASGAPAMPSLPASGGDVAPIGPFGNVTVGSALPGTVAKTEAQQRMGLLSTPLNTAADAVLQNWDALSNTKEQIIGLGGALTKPWQSEEYQKGVLGLQSAISDIIPAISGAAFSNKETQEKIKAFTPRPFDKPGTLKLKKQLFVSYVQGVANASADPQAKAIAQAFLDRINGSQPAPVDMGNGVTIQEIP